MEVLDNYSEFLKNLSVGILAEETILSSEYLSQKALI